MKRGKLLVVSFFLTFLFGLNSHSTNGIVKNTEPVKFYCAWDPAEEDCAKRANGTMCVLVDEDCAPLVIVEPDDPTQ